MVGGCGQSSKVSETVDTSVALLGMRYTCQTHAQGIAAVAGREVVECDRVGLGVRRAASRGDLGREA